MKTKDPHINLPILCSPSSTSSSQAKMSLAKAIITLAAVTVFFELAVATNYTVGAPAGSWDLRTNLSSWDSSFTFKTGDNLIFSYSPSLHNVLEVTKANYDSCSTAGPIKTHSTGKDVIALSSPGTRYFICGFPGHCSSGMKVQITTTAATLTGSPPPSSSPAPSGNPPVPVSPLPSGSVPSTPSTPLSPEGSPQQGSTPSGSPVMEGKVATAGLIGFGLLVLFAV